jgi:nucleoside phosphorylase
MDALIDLLRTCKERARRLVASVGRVDAEHVNRADIKDQTAEAADAYFRQVRPHLISCLGCLACTDIDSAYEALREAAQRRTTRVRYTRALKDLLRALDAVELGLLSGKIEVLHGPAGMPTSKCDVAIVCALHRPELQALIDAFGGERAWRPGPSEGQPHIYKATELEIGSSRLRVIAGAPTYMGLTATAIIATQMVLLFRPRLVVMVGVAAGTKSAHRSFGDILVADPSVDYASGKWALEDGAEVFQPDTFPLPIDPRLRSLVQEDARTRAGLDDIARTWARPKPDSRLSIHIGPLGAADQVVDSVKRVAEVKRNWRKLVGIEMETYALYRAAREAPAPAPLFISFKAVCDFAEQKADDWQPYAAYTAAEYARRFLARHGSSLNLVAG